MSVYIFVVPLLKGSFLLAASGQSPDPCGTRGPVAEGNANNYLHSLSKQGAEWNHSAFIFLMIHGKGDTEVFQF